MQSILEKFVRQIDNFSIRKKMIFIYIFCMLLPITLTDGVIIYTVLHTEAQLRRSEMEDIADAVNYQIFYDVDTVSKVAKSIYANKYINDFLEMEYRDPFDYVVSYQEFFKDTLFQSSDMTGSSLTTLYTDNSTIVSGGRVRNLDLIKESGWYRDLNEKGTEQMLYFAYEPEVLGAVMHPERHVYFVRKMNYYGGGQSEKLLKIEMDYSTINKNLQNLNYDTPVYICHEGKIIFSNRDGENIGDEYEKFSDYKEVEYKKTSNIYGAQLEIYVLRPETDLIGKLVERLPMLLLLFSINIFFPLIMVLLLNRSLTARISRLSSIFRNTEDENLVEIENVSAKDEIGDLMRNYNRMVSRITTLVNIVYKNRILEQEMTVARQKAELLALRSQINPHFLFNALESIRMHSVIRKEKITADDRGQHLEEHPALLGAADPGQHAAAAVQHRRFHHRGQLCGQQRAGSRRLQRLAHLPAHRVQPGHCRGCWCRGVPVSGSQGQGGRAHCSSHLAGPFGHSGCDPDRVRHCRQPGPAHRHEHPRRGAGGCGALYTALFWRRAVQRGV